MGDPQGFLKYGRKELRKQPVSKRLRHSNEFTEGLSAANATEQGARCMDCGVPFCHNGCPLGNNIPEWNHLVSQGLWREALTSLEATNNFPEFTGRICPAPCETACVLGINDDPIAIEALEMAIADRGFDSGWIVANPPLNRTGKKIAIVGSGPAGLAAAQELNRLGHWVEVFERADRPGGLLTYGIPNFKLEKEKVFRRIRLLEEEGIKFSTGIEVGKDLPIPKLREENDAVILTCGATKPRDLEIPGRQIPGVLFADSYLTAQTKAVLRGELSAIHVLGKKVVVIGGGDTGSDCVGTANRQGAASIKQFEILNQPPDIGKFPRAWERPSQTPWPQYTHLLRTSTSQEEGCERHWTLRTKEFRANAKGQLCSLVTEKLIWTQSSKGEHTFTVEAGSEREWPCEIALIAVGYLGPELPLLEDASISLNERGMIDTDGKYQTSQPGVFTAGDMRRGQSLVVWAIQEGRAVAREVEKFLQ